MPFIDPTKETFGAFRADDRPGPIHLVRLRERAAYPAARGERRGGLRRLSAAKQPRGRVSDAPLGCSHGDSRVKH